MKASVIALEDYDQQASRLLTASEREALERHIAENPEIHPIIPETGGLRKARWGRAGMGKRGGVRIIYFYPLSRLTVYLMAIYAKGEKENLSAREKKELRKLAKLIGKGKVQ